MHFASYLFCRLLAIVKECKVTTSRRYIHHKRNYALRNIRYWCKKIEIRV
jgi:hypothetical protein